VTECYSQPLERPREAGGVQDVVMFCQPMYYAQEGEDAELEVEVMRVGAMESSASVLYYTEDGSARAGLKYEATRGELEFAPFESSKTVRVPIRDDNVFSTTLEFKIKLDNPSGCKLGNYLSSCRVKIIDDDVFPSNRFRQEIHQGRVEEIPELLLVWEYAKFAFGTEGICWRTLLFMALDQLHNAYFLLTTYLGIYLVDVIFSKEEEELEKLWIEGSPRKTAMIVAGLYVVPFLFVHLADWANKRLGIPSRCTEFLQTNMFRKYLNFTDEARDEMPSSELALTIVRGTEVVAESYTCLLIIARRFGKLCVVSFFVFMEQPIALSSIALFTICTLPWLCSRIRKFSVLGSEVHEKESNAATMVQTTSEAFRVVADYYQRPRVCDQFHVKAKDISASKSPLLLEEMNSVYFPKWLSVIFLAGYIVLFAQDVLSGDLKVGRFIAMTRVISELGTEFKECYETGVELVKTTGPLQQVTKLLNAQTDLREKRTRSHALAAEMRRRRGDIVKKEGETGSTQADSTDLIPIVISGLSFVYKGCKEGGKNLFSCLELEVGQGSLVAIVGPHGDGKSTFLKVIAGILQPNAGSIFVPPHLRLLYVTKDPILVEGSLWDNLTFGGTERPERVREVLRLMKLPRLLTVLDAELAALEDGVELDTTNWRRQLSGTETAMISIARAFVANPNVLMIQKPTAHFNEEMGALVMQMINSFVKDCGVAMDGPRYLRRPRTCIYTSDFSEWTQNWADEVWEVKSGLVAKLEHSKRRPSSQSLRSAASGRE